MRGWRAWMVSAGVGAAAVVLVALLLPVLLGQRPPLGITDTAWRDAIEAAYWILLATVTVALPRPWAAPAALAVALGAFIAWHSLTPPECPPEAWECLPPSVGLGLGLSLFLMVCTLAAVVATVWRLLLRLAAADPRAANLLGMPARRRPLALAAGLSVAAAVAAYALALGFAWAGPAGIVTGMVVVGFAAAFAPMPWLAALTFLPLHLEANNVWPRTFVPCGQDICPAVYYATPPEIALPGIVLGAVVGGAVGTLLRWRRFGPARAPPTPPPGPTTR